MEYNFTTREAFQQLVDAHGFIEHAQFGGNFYGTSVKAVKDVAAKGQICILDIEMEVRSHSFPPPPPPGDPFLIVFPHFIHLSIHSFIYIHAIRTLNPHLISKQGVKQVKKTDLNARFLFLSPPNLQVLEQRLRSRGTEKEDGVQKRLKQAELEMAYSKEVGAHDKTIVNDELEQAYQELEEWVVDGGRYGSK